MYSRLFRIIYFSVFILLQGPVSAQLVKDSSFGFRGMQFISMPSGSVSTALSFKVLKDGRMVSFVTSYSGGFHSLYLHRTKTNGQPDSSFGINGFQPLGIYGQWINKAGLETDDSGYYYVWGAVSSWNGNSSSGSIWLRRYDSLGIHDTSYNPLPILYSSVQRDLVFDYFTLGKNSRAYVCLANYNDNVLLRLTHSGKIDSAWAQNGFVDSVLFRVKGIIEDQSNRIHIFGLFDNAGNCARMTLSPAGKKDYFRTLKGWLSSKCGEYAAFDNGNFAVMGLEYNTKTKQLEVPVYMYRSMYEVEPSFGKSGFVQVPADSAIRIEAADFLKTKEGNYLLFWRRFNYEERWDDKLIYEDFWSGLTMLDSQGKVITEFGKKGRTYLLDEGRNYFDVKNAQILDDGSLVVLMNIWNGGAYSALLVKYKPLKAAGINLNTDVNQAVSFKVYPNPSKEMFKIEGKGFVNYTIADMSGRKLKSGVLKSSMEFNDVYHQLPGGTYFLKLVDTCNREFAQLILVTE